MAISNYLENKILDCTLRGISYTPPSTVYLALYTSDPTDENTGTEVSGNGYSRKALTFGTPTNGVVTNDSLVQMPIATNPWGTITHIGIFDNSIGGNLLYYGSLNISQTVQTNNQLIINVGNLTITID